MKKEKSLISIIIPTYNRANMLKNAINSILKQDYTEYEIIVVDDCSKDNTQEILKQFSNSKIYYYRNKINSGAGITRKNGYYNSNGQYIIFMDDDDYYLDTHFFSKCMNEFKKNKNVSFVSENSIIYYENINKYEFNPLNISSKIDGLEYLKGFQTKFNKPNSTFTTIFRKDIVAKNGKIDILNDSSIYMNALLYGDAIILDDIAGIYRIHESNITFNLKLDFLIDNLEEKNKIYSNLKTKINLIEAKEWWHNQINLTIKYYVNNTKIEKKQLIKLMEWCKSKGDGLDIEYLERIYSKKGE